MHLAEDVHKFSSACERLLTTATTSRRPLTEEERRLVEYYCREVMAKFISPSKG